jgi:outer membrane protein assembly factor BamA
MDVADLIRRLRHKAPPPAPLDRPGLMRAVAPVIGVKPSSGVIVGVAGNVAFFRGDPATTHISSSVASVTVTSKKQAGVNAHTTMFGRDDRWRAELDYRFQWTSLEGFGLGMDTAAASAEVARFDFYRLHQSVSLRLRPNLFVGGGLHYDSHADVRPEDGAEEAWPSSSYVQYSQANGLPTDTQMSAGPSVEVMWDSRDNFINPDRGWLARASYRALFAGFLGGDSDWDKVTLDVRGYSPSWRRSIADKSPATASWAGWPS